MKCDHDLVTKEVAVTADGECSICANAALNKLAHAGSRILAIENKKWPKFVRKEFAYLRKVLGEV